MRFISFCSLHIRQRIAARCLLLSFFSQIFDTAWLGRLLFDFFGHHDFTRSGCKARGLLLIGVEMRHQFDTFCDFNFFFRWLVFYKLKIFLLKHFQFYNITHQSKAQKRLVIVVLILAQAQADIFTMKNCVFQKVLRFLCFDRCPVHLVIDINLQNSSFESLKQKAFE